MLKLIHEAIETTDLKGSGYAELQAGYSRKLLFAIVAVFLILACIRF